MRRLIDPKTHERSYIDTAEFKAFLKAAESEPPYVETLCLTLAHTGCRLSEALALTPADIDFAAQTLTFYSLKSRPQQRGGSIKRAVPAPPHLLQRLEEVHKVRHAPKRQRLWQRNRASAWRLVAGTMEKAGIVGRQSCPRGLRHGFGVRCLLAEIDLETVQNWLGHTQLITMTVYVDAVHIITKPDGTGGRLEDVWNPPETNSPSEAPHWG